MHITGHKYIVLKIYIQTLIANNPHCIHHMGVINFRVAHARRMIIDFILTMKISLLCYDHAKEMIKHVAIYAPQNMPQAASVQITLSKSCLQFCGFEFSRILDHQSYYMLQ